MNIRSRNANIDNFRKFLASLKGNFGVTVPMESWSNSLATLMKTSMAANKNSSSNLGNYYSVHQTRKNRNSSGICIYTHKQVEFK